MSKEEYVKKHFPEVDPGLTPFGTRVLVQLRLTSTKTASGIVLVDDTKKFNNENTVLCRVVALGELAFRNRDTGQRWPEGVWASPGDIVAIPQWGGFRFKRLAPETGEEIRFAILQDHELVCGIRDGFEELDQIL